MDEDLQDRFKNGGREKSRRLLKANEDINRSREKRHRKRSSSSSSKSRSKSRERSSKKKNKKKKRSSRYSSSDSRSSSRSGSSSSRSRSILREKIRKKNQSNFDKPPDAQESRISQPFALNQVNISSSAPNQGLGPLTVADLLKGKGPGSEQPAFLPSFPSKPKPDVQLGNQHARRIYVGNIPNNLAEPDFVEYIYRCLEAAGGVLDPGNPIISTKLDPERKYIFLEFRSVEEASTSMQLDGLIYQGKVLRFRRPKQYDLMTKPEEKRPVPRLDLSRLENNFVSAKVEDGPTKLFVGGIPHNMDESAVMEMLMKIGVRPVKSFHLVKDKINNQSKGFGFCEYIREQDAIKCIESLNGISIGPNRILQVKRAFNLSERDLLGSGGSSAANLAKNFLDLFNSASQPQPTNFQQTAYIAYQPYMNVFDPMNVQSMQNNMMGNSTNAMNPSMLNPPIIQDEKPVNVLCLGNILNPEELENDKAYDEIYEDLMDEIVTFGQVQSMIVPRRKDGYEGSCLGKVYVEYDNMNSAKQAKATLRTYKYGGKALDPTYYDPHKFMERILL